MSPTPLAADAFSWEMRESETAGVAAAIYLNLAKTTELWHLGAEFVPADHAIIAQAFDAAS